jgi:hypothetical protein
MPDSTISTMSSILKNVYADIAPHQINLEAGAFYTSLKKTNEGVYDGENIRVMASYGILGGFSSPSTDNAALPTANAPQQTQLTSTTKNLIGTFRITEKVIKASMRDEESFIRAMDTNMKACTTAAGYHTGRQIHGDATGILGTYSSGSTTTTWVVTPSADLLEVGMIVDQIKQADGSQVATGVTVTNVDKSTNSVTFDSALTDSGGTGDYIVIQSSYNNEINGLGKVFASTGTYLGVNRANNKWFVPQFNSSVGAISDTVILNEVQKIEKYGGCKIDMICCAYDVQKFYYDYLESLKRAPNTLMLEGGFKTISFNGLPIVADKFIADGIMYLLDTTTFKMHHLEPWDWQSVDGQVISRVSGYPLYQAAYAYYADLMCIKPIANAKLSAITS